MRVAVLGHSTLAKTIRVCCQEANHGVVAPDEADVLWIAYDIPIQHDGYPNTTWLWYQIRDALKPLSPIPILLSSQVPVGFTAGLAEIFPRHVWAYSPENIRTAQALDDFRQQSRIVIGRATPEHDGTWTTLLAPFTKRFVWTTRETAELAKHALNTYLALNITFINEIAQIAKKTGADIETITETLLTERRVSPSAPLRAGSPVPRVSHLGRDLSVLLDHDRIAGPLPLLQALYASMS